MGERDRGDKERLREIEETLKRMEKALSPRRRTARAILSLLMLAAALFLLVTGADGFYRPTPISTYDGDVAVAVAVPPPASNNSSPFKNDTVVPVGAIFYPDEFKAEYRFTFPDRLKGREFVIVLRDISILDNITASIDVRISPPTKCRTTTNAQDRGEHRCELIRGVIPRPEDGTVGLCPVLKDVDFDWEKSVSVTVTGKASFVESLGWAHSRVSLPSMTGAGAGAYMSNWELFGAGPDSWFGTPQQVGCKHALTPRNGTVVESLNPPTTVGQSWMNWDAPDGVHRQAYVVAARNVERNASGLLALSGILAGLAFAIFASSVKSRR